MAPDARFIDDPQLPGGRTVYLETFGCQMNELDSRAGRAGRAAPWATGFTPAPTPRRGPLQHLLVREHAEQKVWSRLGELARKSRRPGAGGRRRAGVHGRARRGATYPPACRSWTCSAAPANSTSCPPAPGQRRADAGRSLAAGRSRARGSPRQRRRRRSPSRATPRAAAPRSRPRQDTLETARPVAAPSRPDDAEVPRRAPAALARTSAITRGCNKFCTYCVVPSPAARGPPPAGPHRRRVQAGWPMPAWSRSRSWARP